MAHCTRPLLVALLAIAVSACGDDPAPSPEPIAIAGDWIDQWDGPHTVTSETWDMGDALFAIVTYDNDAEFAIAQNDAGNEFSPGLWSRFDWTTDGDGQLWFCQTVFDAASREAAEETAPADPTDPATTGCAGFSWTSLDEAEPAAK